jgi:general secretion pathway protein G
VNERNVIARQPGRRAGFTLVEVLTVISIIVLLATIAVPTIYKASEAFRRGAARAQINLLAGGVEQYEKDFNAYPEYPPFDDGAETLCLLMTGWPDDPGTKGAPDMQDGKLRNLHEDDGMEGYGFRTSPRYPSDGYGPYVDPEGVPFGQNDGDDYPVFYSPFANDNTIGRHKYSYYRYDGNDSYGPKSDYALINGQLARKDFLLTTPGPDGKYTKFSEDPTTDDITNFLQEE